MSASVLLDTPILIWMRADPERLNRTERSAIERAVARFVSAASLWELTQLMAGYQLANDLRFFDVPAGFTLLPIAPRHCQELLHLPSSLSDPFDRMLVAQARRDNLVLLSRDDAVRKLVDSVVTDVAY